LVRYIKVSESLRLNTRKALFRERSKIGKTTSNIENKLQKENLK
jgi:hypothetical protein